MEMNVQQVRFQQTSTIVVLCKLHLCRNFRRRLFVTKVVDQINHKQLVFELEMLAKVFLPRRSSSDDQMSIRSSFTGQMISHTCAV
jgi:hypothetical protein